MKNTILLHAGPEARTRDPPVSAHIAESLDSELAISYHEVLRDLLDHFAPVQSRSVMSRPNAPWYSEELHCAKLKKPRKAERTYKRSGLEIHRLIFRQECMDYTSALE